jgi:hypothetical protein
MEQERTEHHGIFAVIEIDNIPAPLLANRRKDYSKWVEMIREIVSALLAGAYTASLYVMVRGWA